MTAKVVLSRDKDCKGSVRFATDDDKQPVTNVYVSRALKGVNEATTITVTVEVPEPPAQKAS